MARKAPTRSAGETTEAPCVWEARRNNSRLEEDGPTRHPRRRAAPNRRDEPWPGSGLPAPAGPGGKLKPRSAAHKAVGRESEKV